MTEDIEKVQKEEPDLYKRSIKGGFWVFAIRLLSQFFGIAKSILVFNFLFTENLELIIVANLLIALLNTFSESGFGAALVQKKDQIEDYLDTAWVINIVRGALLFVLMFFIGPVFVSLKVAPEDVALASSVIKAMSFCFLIQAFQNIGIIYFQKELEFHKTFWLTMAGTITDSLLTIVLLLIYKSIWAYVVARLVTACVKIFMSYLLCPYRPKFNFHYEKAKELWKFGKWLFGGKIIGYLLSEGDDWFVWFFFADPVALKIYRYAYRFSNMPATQITHTISQVTFPAYSKIQNNIPRLREAYIKVFQVTTSISFPVSLIIFLFGSDFVKLMLVKESFEIIPIIQILAFFGLLRSLGETRGALFRAIGKPYINFHLHCIRIVILCLAIYPLTKSLGVAGTALTILLIALILEPAGYCLACKQLEYSLIKFFYRTLLLPIVSSILTGLVMFGLKTICPVKPLNMLLFVTFIVLTGTIYTTLLWTLDSKNKFGIRAIMAEIGQKIKGKISRSRTVS